MNHETFNNTYLGLGAQFSAYFRHSSTSNTLRVGGLGANTRSIEVFHAFTNNYAYWGDGNNGFRRVKLSSRGEIREF